MALRLSEGLGITPRALAPAVPVQLACTDKLLLAHFDTIVERDGHLFVFDFKRPHYAVEYQRLLGGHIENLGLPLSDSVQIDRWFLIVFAVPHSCATNEVSSKTRTFAFEHRAQVANFYREHEVAGYVAFNGLDHSVMEDAPGAWGNLVDMR